MLKIFMTESQQNWRWIRYGIKTLRFLAQTSGNGVCVGGGVVPFAEMRNGGGRGTSFEQR